MSQCSDCSVFVPSLTLTLTQCSTSSVVAPADTPNIEDWSQHRHMEGKTERDTKHVSFYSLGGGGDGGVICPNLVSTTTKHSVVRRITPFLECFLSICRSES